MMRLLYTMWIVAETPQGNWLLLIANRILHAPLATHGCRTMAEEPVA
jgi:hypothetical protein